MRKAVIVINEGLSDAVRLLKKSNAVWRDVPAEGILLRCTHKVTVFRTRKAAREAIKRTQEYFVDRAAKGEPVSWCDEYTLRTLEIEQ